MSEKQSGIINGGCYCGAVRYRVEGRLRDVINCHCSECSRLNGSFGAHSKARKQEIMITRDDGLAWYRISETARRGFCRECGSSLFWDADRQETMGLVAGSLDRPTGLKTIGHIFVAEKSDYYQISDDLPQFPGSSDGKLAGD